MKNLLKYKLQEADNAGYCMLAFLLLQYPPEQPDPPVPPERTDPPKPPEQPSPPAQPERIDPAKPPEQPDPSVPPEQPGPVGRLMSNIYISPLCNNFRFCFLTFLLRFKR